MPKKHLYQLVTLLSVLAYGWIIYNSFFLNTCEGGIAICWFKIVSGLPCPACGSTSGIIEIFKGNLLQAFQLNPFAYSSLFILISSSIWVVYDLIFKKEGFYQLFLKVNTHIKQKRIFIPLIILILSIWIWNIYQSLC
jgi:hypothetical protein